MARIPDNYIPVMARVGKFKKDEPTSRILTETVEANADYVIVKARIFLGDTEVANGQALVDLGEYEDKAFEKAETSAIGRALSNYGIEAKGEEDEDEEPAPKKSSTKSKSKLGGRKTLKKAEPEEVDEEEVESDDLGVPADEDDEEEETEEEEEAPAKTSKVSKLGSRKASSESDKKASMEDRLNKYRKRG